VRRAAMTCLARVVPLPSVTAAALAGQLEEALPVITNCLDDDNTGTRQMGCVVIEALLDKLGSELTRENWVRSLYPELLKRLDDASDEVRVTVCGTLSSLAAAFRYSPVYSEAANFDKTNFQYLLRGLLVHLDDPSYEIQQPVMALLERMMATDVHVFCEEVRGVRERHRTTKLCDKLLAQAAGMGGDVSGELV